MMLIMLMMLMMMMMVMTLIMMMIRLKFPFVSAPPADFQLLKGGRLLKSENVDVSVIEDDVLFRIESATMENSGHYTIVADNGHGEDRIEFDLDIEVPPESPGCPEVLEVTSQSPSY